MIFKKRLIYPLLLMIGVGLSLYLFIFGRHGYYDYKKNLEIYERMREKNLELWQKREELKERNLSLRMLDGEEVEVEARKIPLKREGEELIKLGMEDKEWLEQFLERYDLQFRRSVGRGGMEDFEGLELILGVGASVVLGLILALLLPNQK